MLIPPLGPAHSRRPVAAHPAVSRPGVRPGPRPALPSTPHSIRPRGRPSHDAQGRRAGRRPDRLPLGRGGAWNWSPGAARDPGRPAGPPAPSWGPRPRRGGGVPAPGSCGLRENRRRQSMYLQH